MDQSQTHESYDIVMIGAGVSGIDAAYRIQEQCPGKSYTILEGRENIGGTWDLFRFPGIRSDSDLYSFGFPFRPWPHPNSIAEAPLILEYMNDTAKEFGIDKHIQFRHQLDTADWSSKQQRWQLSVTAGEKTKSITCKFLFLCTGYYDYKNPLTANIPGLSNFKGEVIHPQFWPKDLDYTNKHVVIIGSGATAVTIVPNMAKLTPHVTMLQRSPSYVVAVPQDDGLNRFLRRFMPKSWAFQIIRMRFIMVAYASYSIFQRFPMFARNLLRKQAAKLLPKDYPMDPNFSPSYNPWDQRLCVTPRGDFYKAIRDGRADIVTATIENVTEDSIVLHNGKVLKPDIIVTATGLRIQLAGGAKIRVDGSEVRVNEKFVYRSAMLQDVPNMSLFIGYVNASWTLGADLTAKMMCRLINQMDRDGQAIAVPRVRTEMESTLLLSLSSTYVKEAANLMPKAGTKGAWKPRAMYYGDLWKANRGDFKDLDFVDEIGGGGFTDEVEDDDEKTALQ